MSTYHTAGGQTYTLGSSISSTQTTILLSSFTEPVSGTPYTMVLLNTDIAYGTIAPKTSQSEFISFTGITQNANGSATLTGVTRGLAKKYPYTTDATFKLPHSGQTSFILSNAPQVFEKDARLENDQTFTGVNTFSQSPIVPTGGTGTQAANNQDIANAVTGASGTATNTTFGTTKLSVAADSVPNPIVVGDNDPRVPTQGENDALVGDNTDIAVGSGNKFVTQTGLQHNAEKYAVDTSGSSTAYVITLSPAPTSLTAGMHIYAKIINANTTTTPTLNANGLGAKTIVKGVNTALVPGDIAANMFCDFVYDGTNLVLQIPTAVAPTVWHTVASTQVLTNGSASSFTDIDLSSIVGANECLVMLSGTVQASSGIAGLWVRTKGSSVDYPGVITDAATYGANGISNHSLSTDSTGILMVSTDTSGFIQYKAIGTGPAAQLYVLGYIK